MMVERGRGVVLKIKYMEHNWYGFEIYICEHMAGIYQGGYFLLIRVTFFKL